uniref:Pentacotripeptide-repeat region of PRORP domain-containing protein n=1 Tax=Salix viminalis TaxID=40686 RepID=A0A6N2MM83_SALVM
MVRKGCGPDVHSYNILINGYCKSRRMEEAKSLLAEMSHKALPPDTVCHLHTLMQVYSWEQFSRLFVDGIRPTLQTYSVMIKGLLKEGLSDEAYKSFRKMEDDGFTPDSCSYNVIIQGFLQNRTHQLLYNLLMKWLVRILSGFVYISDVTRSGIS